MVKLYIIHGWTYDLTKWRPFVKLLRMRDIEPIQLKVPGLTEPSHEVWDIDAYVEWLDHELADEPNPIIIGHSNGGRIALAYAQKYPKRFKQLILIDSAGLANHSQWRKTKLKILQGLSKVAKPLKALPLLSRVVYKVIGAQDYNQAPPNMRLTMQNMLAADKTLNLSQISLPITLIWGREDKITPLRDGQAMEQLLPNATLQVIDGAKHAPFFTHPSEVVSIVMKALGKTE